MCSKCLLEKPAIDFGKNKIAADGLRFHCKSCEKISEIEWKSKNWWKKLIHTAKATSKKYNLEFDLTEEFILDLFNSQAGKCFYLKVNLEPSKDGKRKLNAPSIDRIDCSKGYTKDNVVICSQFANLGRCDIPFEEFLRFCDQLNIYEV